MGGERINRRKFLRDEQARIPFSVIGIFIILGSSITTVYISRLEVQKSSEIARSLDFGEIERLLNYLETDLTTALNLAGMKGLREIGKSPVITSPYSTAEDMNVYRVKKIINEQLDVYLTGHYLFNMFSDGRYAINVVLFNEHPIRSLDNITFEPVNMQLDRFAVPLIGPNGTINHSTYWIASVPLTLEIQTMNGDRWDSVTIRTINITSLLTSRYPLLENLVKEYNRTINSNFSSLWTFLTVFSNLYSLARGFKHYRVGKPLNVVDNNHLAVMINSGLLLEQSLVFGSVDPLGLVELARKTKQSLKQTPQDALTTFNEEMEGDGYTVNTKNISQGSANVDAGLPLNTTVDEYPVLNLSAIAGHVLYNITGVTFSLENEQGDSHEEYIAFEGDIQDKFSNLIQQWAAQSYFITKTARHLTINITTFNELHAIISQIYLDTMSSKIVDRHIVSETQGDPGEGWTDGGASLWEPLSVLPLSKQEIKPPKGHITPGCSLYNEFFNVSYERMHYWWRTEEHLINGTLRELKVWNNISDSLIESVQLQILLQHYTKYLDSQDDIVDVLYFNHTVMDANLEDTVSTYLKVYPDSNPEKQMLITTRGNTGAIGLNVTLPGMNQSWFLEEAWDSLVEIYGSINRITLDPSVNITNYPNPVVLFEKAKEDLMGKYDALRTQFLNFIHYHPGNEFCSVGKKAVYYIREWYVNHVQDLCETIFSQILDQLSDAIETAIPENAGFDNQNLTQTMNDASDTLRNQFTIPFGYNMNLTRYDSNRVQLWNETTRLAVDQYPNYLDPFERIHWDNEELWTLKIRNRCIFGPTGLPVLPPSPVTPWVMTINLWVIDVQGEYAQFKILDTSDETIYNPFLGHEPQTYVREMKVVTESNITLGENTRLSFGFSTVAFGVVPPWGMMIGDIQDNWFDEHTPGFPEGD